MQRFVWEYAHVLDHMFATFSKAGATASGTKLILVTPFVHIVGNVCSLEGQRPHHEIVTEVFN